MDSNQFNTSDTNYQDVGYGTSDMMAEGINQLIASNNQQYKQMAQDAIAAAETKSRNFQKLGQLVAQVGDFAPKFQKWADNRAILKAKKADVEKGKENLDKIQDKNAELYTGSMPTGAFDQKFDDSFSKAVYKDKEMEKWQSIQEESNAFNAEGMQIAWKADQDYELTSDVNVLEEGIYVNQSLAVDNFETKGAALVQDVGKSYQGFILANQDTKVPVEGFGMVSLNDAMTANQGAGNPLMYDAVTQFLNESFYFSAEVFSGKNKMSNRHVLELIKNTNATDKQARAQFLQTSYAKSKEQAVTKRRIALSQSLITDPVGTIFGNINDPNSGYIKKAEMMSGKKDTAMAFDMLLGDLNWAVENGYLKAEGLNKVLSMEGIKDRASGQTKSLQELRPRFYEAVQILFDKTAAQETDRKTKSEQNQVTAAVEEAKERLKKIEGGATEADLLNEVTNTKQMLADKGIVVAEENNNVYWRFFQPLTAFVTNEDKVDEDTAKHIRHDLLENDFTNARARLDEINDPKLRTQLEKEIKGYDKIEQNKDAYKAVETSLTEDVSFNLNTKLATANKEMKTSIILDNVKDDLRKKFLYYTSKEGGSLSPDQALDRARSDILANVKAVEGTGKKGKGEGYQEYGSYYLSGDGKRNLFTANAGREANEQLQNEDTRQAWINKQEPHTGEDIEALIQYARGGNIPEFYVEATRNMKYMNSHMLARMRLEALGYSEETKNLAPSVLNNFPNALVKQLVFHPSSEKMGRIFSDPEMFDELPDFVVKSKDPNFGSVGPQRGMPNLNYDTTSIEDIVKAGGFAEQGYGTSGFGSFKLSAARIEELRYITGLDYKTATFTLENQKKLYMAHILTSGEMKKIYSGLDMDLYGSSGLDESDLEGLFDSSNSKFNTPVFSSIPVEDWIYYGSVNEQGETFYYGED